MITELRDEIRKARILAESANLGDVVRSLDLALADLDDTRLVTVAEATLLLDIRAPEVLAVLLRAHGVPTKWQGDTLLIPLSEVERIETSAWVQRLRTLDRLHDLSSDLGGDADMTMEELDALNAGRPGRLPWNSGTYQADQPE